MVNRVRTVRAVVIKRRNAGEADRLLTLFTREEGKLVVRARGVRGARSKRRAHVELFNTIKAQLAFGRGMPVLGQTELLVDRSRLMREMKLLRIAYCLVELVERLTAESQVNREVFGLLDRALSSVDVVGWRREEYLTGEFEKKLLQQVGFGVPAEGSLTEYIEQLVEARLRSRELLSD